MILIQGQKFVKKCRKLVSDKQDPTREFNQGFINKKQNKEMTLFERIKDLWEVELLVNTSEIQKEMSPNLFEQFLVYRNLKTKLGEMTNAVKEIKQKFEERDEDAEDVA